MVIAAVVWGHAWQKAHIRVRSDNSVVVAIINGGYSRDVEAMHLMRCLHFLAARYSFRLSAEHIWGVLNEAADVLSRDSLSTFQELQPTASKSPIPLPPPLLDLLIGSKPDCFVQFYLSQSVASTQITYSAGQKRYLDFCNRRQCIPYLVSENNLLLCISSQSRPDTPNYYVLFISS